MGMITDPASSMAVNSVFEKLQVSVSSSKSSPKLFHLKYLQILMKCGPLAEAGGTVRKKNGNSSSFDLMDLRRMFIFSSVSSGGSVYTKVSYTVRELYACVP